MYWVERVPYHIKKIYNMKSKKQSQSQSLRNRKDQHKSKNDLSKGQESIMIQSIKETLSFLKNKYPKYEFGWEKSMPIHKLYSILTDEYGLDIFLEPVKKSVSLSPDGGFMYVVINDMKYYILVGEQKNQGTNDKRLAEGLKKQALGNAAERLGKNYNCLDLLFSQENILPFVTFLQGCDFHPTETIGERVVMVFKGLKRNTINLFKDSFGRAGTYYMRGHKWDEGEYGSSDFTKSEITKVFKKVAEQSLEYYLNK
jgi:type II restriction enzyme